MWQGSSATSSSGPPPPLQYEPIVTEGNEALVHHMEIFQCAAELDRVPSFSGPCDSKMKPDRLNFCRHVLAAWALGAKVGAAPTFLSNPPTHTHTLVCLICPKNGAWREDLDPWKKPGLPVLSSQKAFSSVCAFLMTV